MYQRIKVLRTEHSVRETAEMLRISTGCVQKYSNMNLQERAEYVQNKKRESQFDMAIEFIEKQVEAFPKIHATKLLRKVKANYPEITAGRRAFRNYLKPIKKKYKNTKIRHYHPVFNTIPGEQVQVDPGEIRVKTDSSGHEMKVYFVSFVFSYSRMMFVSFQNRPYKTEDFIKAHLEAFRFFGGVAKEYVYDQTKLVVIEEKYREVWFNERFHQFATKYELLPVVCEGYDPESKGKVERTVRYIKEDFLYGDYFSNIESVKKASLVWLNTIANTRIHATTKRQPCEMFLEEKRCLNTNYYLKDEANKRIVDKTGLLSYKGCKYSAPSSHQRMEVLIEESGKVLIIRDIESGKELTKHQLSDKKGDTIINMNHYRDYGKTISNLTEEILSILSEVKQADKLLDKVKHDNPRIIRDQLRGIKTLAKKFSFANWNEVVPNLLNFAQIRTSLIEKMLIASRQTEKVREIRKDDSRNLSQQPQSSTLDRSLTFYMRGVKNAE